MSAHQVLYDPQGLLDAQLPLDRVPFEALVKAVLAGSAPGEQLRPRDCEQIALLLTGHARAVACDVQRHVGKLPVEHGRRLLAEVILSEAERVLSTPSQGTVDCVQVRARLVRDLYERLDRVAAPAAVVSP